MTLLVRQPHDSPSAACINQSGMHQSVRASSISPGIINQSRPHQSIQASPVNPGLSIPVIKVESYRLARSAKPCSSRTRQKTVKTVMSVGVSHDQSVEVSHDQSVEVSHDQSVMPSYTTLGTPLQEPDCICLRPYAGACCIGRLVGDWCYGL